MTPSRHDGASVRFALNATRFEWNRAVDACRAVRLLVDGQSIAAERATLSRITWSRCFRSSDLQIADSSSDRTVRVHRTTCALETVDVFALRSMSIRSNRRKRRYRSAAKFRGELSGRPRAA